LLPIIVANIVDMRKHALLFSLCLLVLQAFGQDNRQSPWHIVADSINPNNYYGITVANGQIGIISSPKPLQVSEVVLNGAFDLYGRGRVANMLKVFSFANIQLIVDNTFVERKTVQNFRQELDMKNAIFTTRFDVGDQASVKSDLMALRHLPYTSMQVVEITAKKDITFNVASVIEAPDHLKDVKNFYSEIDRPHVLIPLLTSVAKSPSGKLDVAVSNSFIFEEPHGKEPRLIHEEWDYGRHLAKFYVTLKKGQKYTFSIVGSVTSSANVADPHNEAERLTIFAALERRERLLMRHKQAWADLWESDIIIDGDLEAQKAVRSAMYHLYSFVREGTAYSLSPMGLSGLGYNGHVFWDTELWMYPALLALHPELAKSTLEYRYQRMEPARQNAFSHGYKGVMFPWESDHSGQETCPVWALTGPFQHHITGDVGWAHWKYYQATGDKQWLTDRGYPMLKEVADFWASRVDRQDAFSINNVIGANEWEENVDNNAFTNAMAITSLKYANQAGAVLGKPINFDWQEVSQNIPIMRFPDGVTRENRTYNGQVIKQADVILLAFPLDFYTDTALIRRDLAYYGPKMDKNGPAMGGATLAAIHGRLGEPDLAYQAFVKSYKPNEVPPFGVLSETAGGTNPYFATGAGGMLQAIIYGIGGIELTDNGFSMRNASTLPKGWKSLTFTGIGPDRATYRIIGK
jgi:protein-glucosylgalactosylhydroxylysine glucosidase